MLQSWEIKKINNNSNAMAEDTYHSTFDRRWAVRLTAPEKAMVECLDGGGDLRRR